MRLAKFTLAVVVIVGVLVGLGAEARAAGGNEACLVTSLSAIQGADKIKGTAAVQMINWDGPGDTSADSAVGTLTLSHKGVTAVFIATVNNPVVVSPEAVMCDILDAKPLTATGRTIFDVFGFPTPASPHDTLKLCLVVEPRSQAVLCQSIQQLDLSQLPGTSNWTGVIEKLTIYVIN